MEAEIIRRTFLALVIVGAGLAAYGLTNRVVLVRTAAEIQRFRWICPWGSSDPLLHYAQLRAL